jgi:hypothetical protein
MDVSANEMWMLRLELNQENTSRSCKTTRSLAVHWNARCFFAVLTAGRLKFPRWCKIQAGDKIAAALGTSGAYEKPDALYESPRDGEAAPAPHTDVIASAGDRIRRMRF